MTVFCPVSACVLSTVYVMWFFFLLNNLQFLSWFYFHPKGALLLYEFSRLFFLHVNSELYEGCGRDPCILGSAKCMSENHTGTRTRCYHGSVNISSWNWLLSNWFVVVVDVNVVMVIILTAFLLLFHAFFFTHSCFIPPLNRFFSLSILFLCML